MKVLVLSTDPGIPLFGPSGASAHLRGISRAFRDRGDDVRIAVPRESDHRGAVDDPVGVPVFTAASRSWSWLPGLVRERGETLDSRRVVDAALHGWAPDLIWERHSLFGDGGRKAGVRRIVELNAPLQLERPRFGKLRNPLLARHAERRNLTDGSPRVAAVSRWLAAWAREQGASDVRHIPNGCEDHGPGDREATRARLGLDGLVVGFVGSMKPWHGLERIPWILKWLPRATALVVGDGPVALPEHPRILRVGQVAPRDLRHYVAAMDVGLAPYDADAPSWFCPLKILEYKAQGVPVVAADVGDCGHLVADGSGVTVGTEFPETWAEAAAHAARDVPRIRRVRSWRTVVDEALEGAWTR